MGSSSLTNQLNIDGKTLGTRASGFTEGVNYQASTDGFVYGFVSHTTGSSVLNALCYTDSSATPTTLVVRTQKNDTSESDQHRGFCFPVKADDYWRVDVSANAYNIFFTPMVSAEINVPVIAGQVIQMVNFSENTVSSSSATIPADDTLPQISEGFEVMSLAITPTSATSKLKIEVTAVTECSSSERRCVALFVVGTSDALCAGREYNNTSSCDTTSFTHWMTAGTTSTMTFKVRVGSGAGTTTFNGNNASRQYGGAITSSITITELAT